MPFAELVTPAIKQDDATKSAFHEAMNHLASLVSTAPGMKGAVSGEIINEDRNDIEANPVKIALGLEWEQSNNFIDFISSDEFKAFAPMLRPLVTALPQAQLYETDVEPTAVFRAALAEVFRIPVAEEKLGKVQVAWKGYVKAIGVGGIVSFCGTSLNLEEQLFAGAIGYETKEARAATLGNADIVAARKELELLGASSYAVSFSKL